MDHTEELLELLCDDARPSTADLARLTDLNAEEREGGSEEQQVGVIDDVGAGDERDDERHLTARHGGPFAVPAVSRFGFVASAGREPEASVGADGDPFGLRRGRSQGAAGPLDGAPEAVGGDAGLLGRRLDVEGAALVQCDGRLKRVLLHTRPSGRMDNKSIER